MSVPQLPNPRDGALYEARWINRPRLLWWGSAAAGAALALIAGAVANRGAISLMSIVAGPLGGDFANYYTGALAAASGHAALAYDQAWFYTVEGKVAAAGAAWLPVPQLAVFYSYPPVALLLTLPLVLLPLGSALLVWILAGTGVCFALLRRLIGGKEAALAMLGAPAAVFNLIGGQNGCVTAALFAGGLVVLDRRPLIAGVCLGCLAYKPQMAVLLPFALAVGGYWRAFGAAAATAVSLAGASLVLFGPATWSAFLAQTGWQRHVLETSVGYWHRMPTAFAMLQELGASIPACYAAQALSALCALAAVVAFWRSPASGNVKAASLSVAAFLATPYAWDYDAVLLIFAAAWLAREGRGSGFMPWERAAIVTLLVMPAVTLALSLAVGVQAGPILLWLVLLLTARRAARSCYPRSARERVTAEVAPPQERRCGRPIKLMLTDPRHPCRQPAAENQ